MISVVAFMTHWTTRQKFAVLSLLAVAVFLLVVRFLVRSLVLLQFLLGIFLVLLSVFLLLLLLRLVIFLRLLKPSAHVLVILIRFTFFSSLLSRSLYKAGEPNENLDVVFVFLATIEERMF